MAEKDEILIKRIRGFRAYHGYTQSEVAKKIFVSCPAYRAYESGVAHVPDEVIERLAALYGVTSGRLTGTVKFE